MERLGHPPFAVVARDESLEGGPIVFAQPAGQGWPEIPRDVAEVADLGIRPVALRADPDGPVVGRGGGLVRRHGPTERIEPRGLVEVSVNDEAAAAHLPTAAGAAVRACLPPPASSAARSRSVVTA